MNEILGYAAAVDMAWKSVLLLGGAGLIALALQRASAAARHLVWTLATAATLALPLLALALPSWTWAVLPNPRPIVVAPGPAPIATAARAPSTRGPQPSGLGTSPERERPGAEARRPAEAAPPAVVSAVTASLPGPPASWSVSVWVLVAWLAGAATILAMPVFGRLGLGRLARGTRPIEQGEWREQANELAERLGLVRRVTLLRSDRATMPMTWGWVRPIVLLPAGADEWPAERRRAVLLHELAHVRRRDCLTQAAAQLACALYWFNPLAWLAARRMRVERERACDDMVLGAGARASDYALLLLEMAQKLHSGRSAALAAVSMARPSNLEGRLLAILDPKLRRGRLGRPATALAFGAIAAVLFPLSALRLEAQQAEPVEGEAAVNDSKPQGNPTMTVTGRVLDPAGKPVKGAVVDVLGRARTVWVGASVDDDYHRVLGHGKTGEDGRFRLEASRTSAEGYYHVFALAAAPGFGLGWAELNPDAKAPEAEVRLRTEQPVRVKLVDVTGMPAAGLEVRVKGMFRGSEDENVEGRPEGIYLSEDLPKGLKAWPLPPVTDDQGQFLLSGIGSGFRVSLDVRDLRFARQAPEVKTEGPAATVALEPARIIEGRVLAQDTGRAIPNAIIAAAARIQNEHANGFFTTKFQADAEGRFKINPYLSDQYTLNAFPPAGEPYLIAQDEVKWTNKGAVKVDHDFKLRRGVLLRGKVTEQGTGRPLAGSSVQFIPIRGGDNLLSGWQAIVASGADGLFQIAVPPGKGHLLIFGPTSEYVLEATSERMVYNGKPGGRRYYAHKVVAYDVRAGSDPVDTDAALRPGKTVNVRIVGPEGQTVTEAFYLTALRISAVNPSWRGDSADPIRDGRFTLQGLSPEGKARVDIFDPTHQWGASVEVSGQQAGKELMVTLKPCGRAKARFVGPDGKPLAKHVPNFEYIATPGPHPFTGNKKLQAELAADAEYMPNADRKHYWNSPATDAEGRITLPDLVPGALYRINDFSTVNEPDKGVQVRKDFTVKSGETLDLGDILIEKPQA